MKPGSWKIISHHNTYDDLYEKSSVIFEFADEFWKLHADKEKFLDVWNMPSYIVEDWLWVNRMVIDEETIEYHIKIAEADVKHETIKHRSLMKALPSNVFNEKNSERDITNAEEKLSILLAIRRSIKINKIIT
jgi:ferredoxin-like protein FixX